MSIGVNGPEQLAFRLESERSVLRERIASMISYQSTPGLSEHVRTAMQGAIDAARADLANVEYKIKLADLPRSP